MKVQFKHKQTEFSFEVNPTLIFLAVNLVIKYADDIRSIIESLAW